MVLGTIMTIIGFLGCIGAIQESQCMLATFFAMVLVILVGQIAASVFFFTNHKTFEKQFGKTLKESLQEHYENDDLKTRAFDGLQMELKCCGVDGPEDWASSVINLGVGMNNIKNGVSGTRGVYKVPKSCCLTQDANECNNARQLTYSESSFPDAIYNKGCKHKAMEYLHLHGLRVLIVFIELIILIELLAMIFSMELCCAVRRINQFKA